MLWICHGELEDNCGDIYAIRSIQRGETSRRMDKVRREGWDRDARVSRLERRIMQIGGIVLGLVVLGVGLPFSYFARIATSFWAIPSLPSVPSP